MANQAIRQTALALPIGDYISSKLDDDNYRTVLKAKILQNQWKGTKKEIYDFWAGQFPDTPILVIDNQDMSYDVLIVGYTNLSYQDKINKSLIANQYIFPKPVGVKVNYSYSSNPVFAYGPETEYLKGYGVGKWLSG